MEEGIVYICFLEGGIVVGYWMFLSLEWFYYVGRVDFIEVLIKFFFLRGFLE